MFRVRFMIANTYLCNALNITTYIHIMYVCGKNNVVIYGNTYVYNINISVIKTLYLQESSAL